MNSPAFQFYPADWLSNEKVATSTLEEEGAYIRLLCYAWREGSIPADPKRCAMLIGKGASEELARVVQGWFKQHPTDVARLVHSRLERERQKQISWREKSAEGGKKSAEKRAKTRVSKGGSTTIEKMVEPKGNSSSSSSSSEETNSNARAKARGTIEEIRAFCVELGLPASDGDACFHKWEGKGWKNGGDPIKCWRSTIRSWNSSKYLPSQKTSEKSGNGSKPIQPPTNNLHGKPTRIV